MKTTVFLSGAFRSVPAICLLAGTVLAAAPAFAAGEGAAQQPAAKQQSYREALLEEAAARVKEKALFAAGMTPKATRILQGFDGGHRYADPVALIDNLWLLKSAPALQKEWLGKMSAPDLPAEKRKEAVRDFFAFVEETERFMRDERDIRPGNVWTMLRGTVRTLTSGEDPQSPAMRDMNAIAEKLARAKAREEAFAEALVISGLARKAEISPREAREYGRLLLPLQDRPEDMQLAVSIIRNDGICNDHHALLRKIAENPEEARKEIADLEKAMQAEARYKYASRGEKGPYFTMLPVAAIVPGVEKAMEKSGSVPLAASAPGAPEKTLTVKRLAALMPENATLSAADGSLVQPPFLHKNEKLYMVEPERLGSPVFSGTALDSVALAGPRVLALTGETAKFFDHCARSGGGGYLVAAACGPEELAAHMASLSVMLTDRETSLFNSGDKNNSQNTQRRRSYYQKRFGGELPEDTPGETLRLVQIDDPALFTVLAPLADQKGLARLMGPIRGVWMRSNGRYEATPWTELRYAPGSGKAVAFALGASPAPKLDKAALAALVANREEAIILSWVNHKQQQLGHEKGAPLTAEQGRETFPAMLAAMQETFADMRAKGFANPMEISVALYYLEEFGKNEAKLAAIRAIIDDTSRTPVDRLDALEEAALQ